MNNVTVTHDVIIVHLPIETVSEANQSEHWSKKHKRHKHQKLHIDLQWQYIPKIKLPCTIRLTRISPRTLDDDNLLSAFKHIRDCIADKLFPEKTIGISKKTNLPCKISGRSDSNPNVKWLYNQEKGRFSQEFKQGIRIEIVQRSVI